MFPFINFIYQNEKTREFYKFQRELINLESKPLPITSVSHSTFNNSQELDVHDFNWITSAEKNESDCTSSTCIDNLVSDVLPDSGLNRISSNNRDPVDDAEFIENLCKELNCDINENNKHKETQEYSNITELCNIENNNHNIIKMEFDNTLITNNLGHSKNIISSPKKLQKCIQNVLHKLKDDKITKRGSDFKQSKNKVQSKANQKQILSQNSKMLNRILRNSPFDFLNQIKRINKTSGASIEITTLRDVTTNRTCRQKLQS